MRTLRAESVVRLLCALELDVDGVCDVFALFCRARAAVSRGRSYVVNLLQQSRENRRKSCPRRVVLFPKWKSVVSVCNRSFPNECQVASSKSRSRMMELNGSGTRPSKTGITHYDNVRTRARKLIHKHTCRISSKSRAASLERSDTFELNFRIVSRPNVGIERKLELQ